jgi:hypothetical protein
LRLVCKKTNVIISQTLPQDENPKSFYEIIGCRCDLRKMLLGWDVEKSAYYKHHLRYCAAELHYTSICHYLYMCYVYRYSKRKVNPNSIFDEMLPPIEFQSPAEAYHFFAIRERSYNHVYNCHTILQPKTKRRNMLVSQTRIHIPPGLLWLNPVQEKCKLCESVLGRVWFT